MNVLILYLHSWCNAVPQSRSQASPHLCPHPTGSVHRTISPQRPLPRFPSEQTLKAVISTRRLLLLLLLLLQRLQVLQLGTAALIATSQLRHPVPSVGRPLQRPPSPHHRPASLSIANLCHASNVQVCRLFRTPSSTPHTRSQCVAVADDREPVRARPAANKC